MMQSAMIKDSLSLVLKFWSWHCILTILISQIICEVKMAVSVIQFLCKSQGIYFFPPKKSTSFKMSGDRKLWFRTKGSWMFWWELTTVEYHWVYLDLILTQPIYHLSSRGKSLWDYKWDFWKNKRSNEYLHKTSTITLLTTGAENYIYNTVFNHVKTYYLVDLNVTSLFETQGRKNPESRTLRAFTETPRQPTM